MKLLWVAFSLLALTLLVVRFVQPVFIYWLRELVVEIRMNKTMLESDRAGDGERRRDGYPARDGNGGRDPNGYRREYIRLMVMDLRPDGVSGERQKILPRVLDVRKLYSLLDPRREQVKDLPQVRSSQKCVIELANMLASLARDLEPNASFDYSSIKADELLHMIVQRRGEKSGELAGLPARDDEDLDEKLEVYLRERPLTIEQLNELLIAAIHATAYRLEGDERRRQEASERQARLARAGGSRTAAMGAPQP